MKVLKVVPSNDLFPSLLELVEQGEITSFVVAGMSMWPFMRHGRDLVFIEKCDVQKVKKGDVVLLQTPEGVYLLHRIMKRHGDKIVTAGDNKCRYDGEFEISNIKAKVCMVKRGEKIIQCRHVRWRFLFWLWRVSFPIRGKMLGLARLMLRHRASDET